MNQRCGWVTVALLVLIASVVWAQSRNITVDGMRSEKRLALVIGNSAYGTSPLKNPVKDARAVAETLKTLGFDVIARENVSQKDMRLSIIDFGNRLQGGGVGFFYYAGHGAQVAGRNYLIPIGADIKSESEVEVESVDVASVLARMETAKNRLNIVVLDACRDNPFGRSYRSSSRGLAAVDAPIGTMIAYATAPGQLAADGRGDNSPYATALVTAMREPGLSLENVFKRVLTMVRQETSGQQVPWVLASVEGEFMFSLPPRVATSPAAPSPRESLSEEGARLDQERRRLENERKRLDEERTRVAAAPRVGVLDVELVLARSAAGISARETLERETSEFRRIMDFKRDELQKLRDELEKKGPLMTGDVRQEKIAVFERKRKEAAQLADDFQKELAKHEQAFLKQVLTGIGEAVKDLGVEQGYEAIVEKGTSKPMYTRTSTTVIGTTQGVDVTPDVIHRFDERTRRSAR